MMSDVEPPITADQIVAGIRALGVRPGDLVLVHSSLRSFGRVEGGARAVAEALIRSVQPGGTVVVPTFTYAAEPFDPRTTPSQTGAISESFRQLPGVVRSAHPTHSLAAMGPLAAELLIGHERTQPFDADSPLKRLCDAGGWVLLLGVDHRASSMVHVAEELEHVPYLDRTRSAPVVREGGRIEIVQVRRPGGSHAFNKIDAPLRWIGAIIDGQIGPCEAMLMRARDLVSVVRSMLRKDPGALLCSDPACAVCSEARRMIEAARERSGM